ncbi:unnamed protein product [Mytilus coruscus]|uniref:Reverse transcriptase domain-containing protein n=1 Tax=Mytilus coruscus TaxID=42192 RepID=A0A6J8C3V6_MYTCO|nr:unnamed protein product [Mytilus coruscus]
MGSAVNDFAGEFDKQRFQTVDDACKLVSKNFYMAKVDLKAAYRSVRISKQSQKVTGLKWAFPDGHEYTFIDKKLPFGSKLAPGIFHRLSQAVRRMMSRRGFTIVAYLDDFYICERTKKRCAQALAVLIALLRKLGFCISWSKVTDPCQKIVFLGVEIDSTTLETRLPISKLTDLKSELAEFLLRKQDWHKLRMSGEILHDIKWWHDFMSTFNGKSFFLAKVPITSVVTDACKSGAGGFYHSDWCYVNWVEDYPFATQLHINELEAFSVALAVKRWAQNWRGKCIIVYCDNAATISCINKCTSKNAILMSFLRELFWLSATYNFHIIAKHVPGKENILADHISQLHDLTYCEKFLRFYVQPPLLVRDLVKHMSSNAIRFLLLRLTGIQGDDNTG